MPLAYTKTERFKYLGDYGSSPDITGGMGLEGVVELQKFVEKGGLLITLGVASDLPADFGITRRVEETHTSAAILCARAHRGSRGSAAHASRLLWLHREDHAGAMGEWAAADGSAGRS